jgi:hypothetical protein
MKSVHNLVDKDPENGKLRTQIELDADDSLILNSALQAFSEYDQDDFKYIAKLEHVKEEVHKIWAVLHPS